MTPLNTRPFPDIFTIYSRVLFLICALSGLAYGDPPGQDNPPVPRSGYIASDLPSGLEGNWLIEWGGEGRAYAVLGQHWEQKRIEVFGGGGSYHNKVHETDKSWTLNYTSDLQNWGGSSPEVDQKRKKLDVKWGHGTLGGWGGSSELQQTGPNQIRGSWKYPAEGKIEKGGGEVWQRVLPDIKKVVFKVASYTWGSDESAVESVWTPGGAPAYIESTYSKEDMRGNRPQFKVEIYGENLWGHHLIDVGGAVDLEPLPEWQTYILKDGTRYSALTAPPHVAGIEQYIVVWPEAQSGKYALRVDGIAIPFDLVIKGHPGANAAAGQDTPTENPILTMLAIFAAAALATAVFGPMGGIVFGLVLTGKSLWGSYQKGGIQQVFEDVGAFDVMDAVFRPNLTTGERLRKFIIGAATLGGTATDVVPVASGTAFAISKLGKRLLGEKLAKKLLLRGRPALDAARIAGRTSRSINGKPLAKLPHPGLIAPTPTSGRKLLQKNIKTVFENKKTVDYGSFPTKDRYAAFDKDVNKSVYGPLYSKPAGRQKTDLTVPKGKTYDQVHAEYVEKLPTKNQFADGDSWRYHAGEAYERPIKQRIWINADPNHSPGLMDYILKDMDGVNQAKIAKKDLGRVDSVVIYTDGDKTTERILKRLEDYQKKSPEAFRDGTPPTTHQPLRGVAVGDHPTNAMKEATRKVIAQRLGIDESAVGKIDKHGNVKPASFSYGELRSIAHYFAEQDVQALKASGKLNPQAEAFYREQRTQDWYGAIGIDPNQPNKNLPKPKENFQIWPPSLPK